MRPSFETVTALLAIVVTGSAWFLANQTDAAATQHREPLQAPATPPPSEEISDCLASLAGLPGEYAADARAKEGDLVVVFKRAYKIGLYRNGQLVVEDGVRACFPISMGATPFDPKVQYDNASTPEGWYYAASKHTTDPNDEYPHTSFGQALLVSYPNLGDIDRAEKVGVIDAGLAAHMRAQVAAGELPAQNGPMGGAILIHAWFTQQRDATAGCVGVDDPNMDWLFRHTEAGIPILLLPYRDIIYTDGTFARDDRVLEPLDAASAEAMAELMKQLPRTAGGTILFPPMVVTATDP